jgi:hypothetical protein
VNRAYLDTSAFLRAVFRGEGDHQSARALGRVAAADLDREVIVAARAIPEVAKSGDAVDIATAVLLADSIDCVVAYDAKMAAVLRAHGVAAVTASSAMAKRPS